MKRPFELVAEIQQKDAEIERLQFLNKEEQATIDHLSSLITELCDALGARSHVDDNHAWALIQRAREATRMSEDKERTNGVPSSASGRQKGGYGLGK